MGHMLKNTVFKSGGHTLGVPTGSNTIVTDSPSNGMTRYNTSTNKLEFYNNSKWNAIASEGSTTIVKDVFTGDDTATVFGQMSYTYLSGQEAQTLVFLNTVFQNPGVNYTFNGTNNITFTSAPVNNSVIVI